MRITLVTDDDNLGKRLRDIRGFFYITDEAANKYQFQTRVPAKKKDRTAKQRDLDERLETEMQRQTGGLHMASRQGKLVDVFGRELCTQDGNLAYLLKGVEATNDRRRRKNDSPRLKTQFVFDVAENMSIFEEEIKEGQVWSAPMVPIIKKREGDRIGKIYRQRRVLEILDHSDALLVNNHGVFYTRERTTDTAEGSQTRRDRDFIHRAHYIDPKTGMLRPLYTSQGRSGTKEVEEFALTKPDLFCNVSPEFTTERSVQIYEDIKFLKPVGNFDYFFSRRYNAKVALAFLLNENKKKQDRGGDAVMVPIVGVCETILHYDCLSHPGLTLRHTTTEYSNNLGTHGYATYRLEIMAEDDRSEELAERVANELLTHESLTKPAYPADPWYHRMKEAGDIYARQVENSTEAAIIMKALSHVQVPKMRIYVEGTQLTKQDPDSEELNLGDDSEATLLAFNGAREVRYLGEEKLCGTETLRSNFKSFKTNGNGYH
jgi:hypothetical protein